MIRFTSKVRRGLRQFVDRGLSNHIEEIIRQATAPGVPRDKRLTAPECAELRAAAAWIAQEAAGESEKSAAGAEEVTA